MESTVTKGLANNESDQRPEQIPPIFTASDLYHLNLAQDMAENCGDQISTTMETAQSDAGVGGRDFHHHGMKTKKSDNKESPRKRQKSKASQDGSQSDSYGVKSDSSSPGRSGKQTSRKSYQDGKSGSGRSGEVTQKKNFLIFFLHSLSISSVHLFVLL